MELPIYKLIINPEDETGVEFVSLVTKPAIERDFQYFNDQFVDPRPGESKDEFITRCIEYVVKEGKDQEQAAAICYSMWKQNFAKVSFDWDGVGSTADGKKLIEEAIANGDEVYIISARDSKENINIDIPADHIFAVGSNKAKVEKVKELGISKHFDNNPDVVRELGRIGEKFMFESYNDYPKAAGQNAARGMKLNEAIGNQCATLVGKNRANQLANQEPISMETIKRTYSFLSRAKTYYDKNDKESCGTISYLLWGGDEMLSWTERKLEQLQMRKARRGFAIQSEEKRIISGAAMIADLPIYRYDDQRGEYYVVFDKETIFEIAKKWAKQDKYDSVNIHHDVPSHGLSLFESYLVDRERGIMPPKGYEEVADGSWFVSYLVNDDQIWERVKNGEFRGFSVEGIFDFDMSQQQKVEDTLFRKLKEIASKWDGKN